MLKDVNARTWKAWLVPGGLLLALMATLVNSSLFQQIAPSLGFYYGAAFAAGLLLAWRFNSSRVLFSLVILLLAHRAVDFYGTAGPLDAGEVHTGPGRMALTLVALLVPLNFIVFASMRERGLIIAGVAPQFGLLFLESVIFAVLCRPENSPSSSDHAAGSPIPLWIVLSFLLAIVVFVRRFFQTRRPVEPGFVWATAAVFLWLRFAPVGKMSVAYVATAALILAASLIETSYVLAYHDELTGIRGRRAFNESLLSLDQQYAIAIVDIDHFKKFNDTYGHDVGDQVLCMVARRLSQVGGDGQAFRCGGEEFAIIFRNLSAQEGFAHLDALRQIIEQSAFHMRSSDRRSESKTVGGNESRGDRRSRESDRRKTAKKKIVKNHGRLQRITGLDSVSKQGGLDRPERPAKSVPLSSAKAAVEQVNLFPRPMDQLPDCLSVTVSIGIAEPSTRYRQPEQVIQAADQALYRAKIKGRNRVELAFTARFGIAAGKRSKAARL
jgi:diguanylate cyclase (GGDEF)-like protein